MPVCPCFQEIFLSTLELLWFTWFVLVIVVFVILICFLKYACSLLMIDCLKFSKIFIKTLVVQVFDKIFFEVFYLISIDLIEYFGWSFLPCWFSRKVWRILSSLSGEFEKRLISDKKSQKESKQESWVFIFKSLYTKDVMWGPLFLFLTFFL